MAELGYVDCAVDFISDTIFSYLLFFYYVFVFN